MKLYEIISNMKFIGIKYYQEEDIEALTCNSHEKCANSIYFCLKGQNYDGHDFANEAIENGAVCLVVERFLDFPITQILVENSRSAMSYICSIFWPCDVTCFPLACPANGVNMSKAILSSFKLVFTGILTQ